MTDAPQHNVFEPGPAPDTNEELPIITPPGHTHLFSLGEGAKREHFFMPDEVPPNIAFAFLRDRRREDMPYAIAGLIEKLIGPKALDALADAEDMSPEDMKTLMKIINDKAMGKMEEAMSLGN
jgi:hypothetical protein